MRKDDLFKELDDMDIDGIAQEFPVLTDDEKERIYAMSERKYNIENNTDKDYSDGDETVVSGVEQYKRPIWYKYVSAAAAAVLTIGGITGSMLLMKNGKNIDPADEMTTSTTEEITTSTTATETTTEAATEDITEDITYAEGSHEAVAAYLTDRFADITNKLFGRIEFDPNDSITFDFSNYDPDNGYVYKPTFSRVTEPGFEQNTDFLNAFREICTDEFYDRLENKGGGNNDPDSYNMGVNIWPSYQFKADLSDHENGDHVDIYSEIENKNTEFIMYRGGLYVSSDYTSEKKDNYSDQPALKDEGEDSFKAVRCALFTPACNSTYSKTGNPLTFSFVKEDDSWKISDIIEGPNMESIAWLAARNYFINEDTQYKNKSLFLDSFSEDADVSMYDYYRSFRAHCIIKDIYGNPALDFTADIEPEPYTGYRNSEGYDYNIIEGYKYSNVVIKELS